MNPQKYKKLAEEGDVNAMFQLLVDDSPFCPVLSDEQKKTYSAIVFRSSRDKSQLGDALSMYHLGVCYRCSWGCEKNEKLSEEWLHMASDAGDPDAMFEYSRILRMDKSNPKSIERSMDLLKAASAKGNYRATEIFSKLLYKQGDSTHGLEYEKLLYKQCLDSHNAGDIDAASFISILKIKDDGEELTEKDLHNWKLISAKQGDPFEQYSLGVDFMDGEGCEESPTEAFHWFKLSAEQGYGLAECEVADCYFWGVGTEKSYTEAFYWYKRAAEHRQSSAVLMIAKMYYYGKGVEEDFDAAFVWFNNALSQGETDAYYYLGEMHLYGWSVPQSDRKAFEMFLAGANKGEKESMFMLWLMYEDGHNRYITFDEHLMWLRKSAELGCIDARYFLAKFIIGTTYDQESKKKAFDMLVANVSENDYHSLWHLAICCRDGIGTEVDEDEAYRCWLVYKDAREKGCIDWEYWEQLESGDDAIEPLGTDTDDTLDEALEEYFYG